MDPTAECLDRLKELLATTPTTYCPTPKSTISCVYDVLEEMGVYGGCEWITLPEEPKEEPTEFDHTVTAVSTSSASLSSTNTE